MSPKDLTPYDVTNIKSVGDFVLQRLRRLSEVSSVPAQVYREFLTSETDSQRGILKMNGLLQFFQIDAEHDVETSYSELLHKSVEAALGLRARGLSVGDTVAIFSRDDCFETVLGAFFEGITIICLEPSWKEDELSRVLAVVKPRLILSDSKRLPIALKAAAGGTLHVLTSSEAAAAGATTLEAFLRPGPPRGEVEPGDYAAREIGDLQQHIAAIAFTSGTTGVPKAAAHSSKAFIMGFFQPSLLGRLGLIPGDRFKLNKSMAWIADLIFSLVCIINGLTRVVVNECSGDHTLHVLQKYKVNSWFAIPSELQQLAELVRARRPRPDLSSVRHVICSGAPLSSQRQEAIAGDLGLPVCQLYGSTEVVATAVDSCPPTPGSAGLPLPWVQMKLVDLQTGAVISSPNVLGEVRVKTPSALTYFLNNAQATQEAFDEEGFYRPGDVGYRNADGKIFICDRIKHVFKYDGFQVSPAEIESVILEHPDVREVCVGGRPHDWLGEIPAALVVRRPGSGAELSAHQLQAAVKERLSEAKQLKGGVFFVESLPHTATGKINRSAVRDILMKMPFEKNEMNSLGRPAQNLD